ncbi:MAG: AAA family ATPase [Elusimicrobia bacterium]|nr:AAA family ATPase [Candidatus Omnitrophota bacterium]MCG2724863.1 AAA family ATPase [Elusimicrobiota bacterium]
MYKRIQKLELSKTETCFFLGPRQTGKSTLLKKLFPRSKYYDLLLSEEFERFSKKPALLREELLAVPPKAPVIIDEIQTVPTLLNEVQWLIVNKNIRFILCGSSARKLRRTGANLLGGRAVHYELFPLVSNEIPKFDIHKALNNGLLPRHYSANKAKKLIHAYIGDYLKEEISAEAVSRNISVFSRFLEKVAFSNGEIVNYNNIASDCGVSSPTVKNYFKILSDTLLGQFIPSFRKKPKRRVILAPKFYFFDISLPNFLLKRTEVIQGNEVFGKAFEHFIFQEIKAYSHYSGLEYETAYWRTASQLEVDFILGGGEVALEVKGVKEVLPGHLKGLRAFGEEYSSCKRIVVSLDNNPRLIDGIEILPWKIFLDRLWSGKIIH